MGRKCLNSPDKFYYICGQFTPKCWRYPITNKIKDAYKNYFNISSIVQDKSWAPHISCKICVNYLYQYNIILS